MIQENEKGNRKIYVDILRCVAIFMVLFNHSASAGYMLFTKYPVGTLRHFLYLMNSIFIKCGVPLFFVISGALLLKREESISMVLKRFFKYLCVLVVASLITYIWSGKVGGYYESISLREFFRILYTSRHATAYWYLYTYLMYILMLPILRKITKTMVPREYMYIVVIYIILNTLGYIDFVIWKGEYWHNSYMTCFVMMDYVLYPIMGYYFENIIDIKKVSKKHIFTMIAVSIATIVLNTAMTDYRCQIIDSWSEAYCQLFFEKYILIVVATVYITMKYIIDKRNLPNMVFKFISMCGKCTFGIYLFERIWRHETEFVYRWLNGICPPLVNCWIWILAACLLGGIITAVLKKFPVIKNYI